MAQRPQSLTAELERIEMQITLAMQEIDANFARAHRIITNSIIPVVERYQTHSDAVSEGTKFWRQFFETSAGITLDTVKESNETTIADETTVRADNTGVSSPGNYREGEDGLMGMRVPLNDDSELLDEQMEEDTIMASLQMQSTPEPRQPWKQEEETDSSYQMLAQELTAKYDLPAPGASKQQMLEDESSLSIAAPSTPRTGKSRIGGGGSGSGYPDPTTPSSTLPHPTTIRGAPTTTPGRLLHQTATKSWRIQATPGAAPMSKYRASAASMIPSVTTPARPNPHNFTNDSSPLSSPIQYPEFQTQVLNTPGPGPSHARTPARLLLTRDWGFTGGPPGTGTIKSKTPAKNTAGTTGGTKYGGYDFGDSDDDDIFLPPGFSPPKTMQFSIPASKLIATPAREASRRIVKDILQTAGADDTITTATDTTTRDTGERKSFVGEDSSFLEDLRGGPKRVVKEEDPFDG
ncbi:DASH complex subunit Ask1-domain-containing protein [Pyronema omphalodes]|nr:DASH complex subunit Ask1-domain-containing protein [Pyronema omphalodes]